MCDFIVFSFGVKTLKRQVLTPLQSSIKPTKNEAECLHNRLIKLRVPFLLREGMEGRLQSF